MTPALLLLAGLAGVGFAQLVRASPLARIRHKPFSCKTCLSGWGAIFFGLAAAPPGDPLAFVVQCFAFGVVGTGGAALLFAALDLLHALYGAAGRSGAPREIYTDEKPAPPVTIGG